MRADSIKEYKRSQLNAVGIVEVEKELNNL